MTEKVKQESNKDRIQMISDIAWCIGYIEALGENPDYLEEIKKRLAQNSGEN